MTDTVRSLIARSDDQEGATAVEYGIMVALIAVVIIAAVSFIGSQLNDTFTCTGDSIAAAANECAPAPAP